MDDMIECGNCGYPLLPIERTSMVEFNDKVYTTELKNALELQALVKEFFNKYLNHIEESEGGRLFNPITIGCCRVLMLEPLGALLERMRVLTEAKPNPLEKNT